MPDNVAALDTKLLCNLYLPNSGPLGAARASRNSRARIILECSSEGSDDFCGQRFDEEAAARQIIQGVCTLCQTCRCCQAARRQSSCPRRPCRCQTPTQSQCK